MNPRVRKLLAYGTAVVVLMSVFTLYMQPALIVALADQLWACF